MVEKSSVIPPSFICPLSNKIMNDPVLDREGNTFDRESIMEHLKKSERNPLDPSKALHQHELTPNKALKLTIEEYKANINKENELKDLSTLEADLHVTSYEGYSLISITPPKEKAGCPRTPLSICCVIDVSGSMGSEASIKSEGGQSESFGFTVLDLVKHALKTIIHSLEGCDNLALVSFEKTAKVELKMTRMDATGKNMAIRALDQLDADGSTNIWAGLETGLNIIRTADIGLNTSILLLTDGQPVVIPPEGHIGALKKYKQDCGGSLPSAIYTFGFGNELDCALLNELSKEGGGTFSYIPDGSFVGTIFINALSNLLNIAAIDVNLTFKGIRSQEVPFLKHFRSEDEDYDTTIKLDSIRFGQSKDLIIPTALLTNGIKTSLSYMCPFQGKVSKEKTLLLKNLHDELTLMQVFRLKAANLLQDIVLSKEFPDLEEARIKITDLILEIENSEVKNQAFTKDLLTDLKGEVSLGLSKEEFYKSWGKNYLFSISKAHLWQICNNFKDPGVQHYGGVRFLAIRDKLDSIFLSLPPPNPTFPNENNAQLSNMAVYYDNRGPCFSGHSICLMWDNTHKLVKELKKGDKVMTPRGIAAEIICVVKTSTCQGKTPIVEFDTGLKITPWHPVRIDGVFRFPADLKTPTITDCDFIYNLVLSEEHLVILNNIETVTLGHELKEGIVNHEYFGTQKIVKDLKSLRGWDSGLISLRWDCIQRDINSGLVCRIEQHT